MIPEDAILALSYMQRAEKKPMFHLTDNTKDLRIALRWYRQHFSRAAIYGTSQITEDDTDNLRRWFVKDAIETKLRRLTGSTDTTTPRAWRELGYGT